MAIIKRETKDGKTAYQVRIAVIDPRTGRRNNKTIGTYRTKRQAEAEERKALVEQERGTLVDPSKVTVGELLSSWLSTKAGSISPNSHRDYEVAARLHLEPAFGKVKAQRLGAADVQKQYDAWRDEYAAHQAALARWKQERAQWSTLPPTTRGLEPEKPDGPRGLGPRMIHRCHVVLSQALGQAVRFGILPRNVCKDVTKPSLGRNKPTVWTPAEARAFLEHAKQDTLAPLWFLLTLEGMRRGEALGLRWSDINWERGVAHIAQTITANKNDKGKAVIQPRTKTQAGSRSVRLTHETIEVLKAHRSAQLERRLAASEWEDHDLILSTSHGSPINPTNVSRAFSRLVMLSGVPKIRVHDTRHTAATLLLRAGIPAKVVSERLGHANISITLGTYSHVLPDMQDDAASAMSAILASAEKLG